MKFMGDSSTKSSQNSCWGISFSLFCDPKIFRGENWFWVGAGRGKTPSCLLPTLLPRDSFLKFFLTKYHNFYSIKIFKMQKYLWKRKNKTFDLDSFKGVNSLSDLFQRVGSASYRLHGEKTALQKSKTNVAQFTSCLGLPCLWIYWSL